MADKTLTRDMTQGSIPRLILSFSVFLMLGNLLQIFYNMVDMVVVGNFVGSEGLSAVSNGGDVMNLATLFCMGFCSAGQALISQAIGRKDTKGASTMIGTMVSFLAIVSVVITFGGLRLCGTIIRWIHVPEQASQMAWEYSSICMAGMVFIFGYNYVAAILRGLGDSKRPMLFVLISTVINLTLDLLFTGYLGMGVRGAALATVIGQACSFLFSVVYLYRRRTSLGIILTMKSFRIDVQALKALIKLGLPMAFSHASVSISKMFLNSFINQYGLYASAVNGVGVKISQTAMIVTNGLATAGTTVIGQNYGAGRKDRVKSSVYFILEFGLAFTALLAVIIILFPTQIFSLFNREPEVLAWTRTYKYIIAANFIGFALRSPMNSLFQGLGDSRMNFVIALLDAFLARIGLSMVFGLVLGLGIYGFWLGDLCASFCPFIIGSVYFWGGHWEKRFQG